MPRRSSVRSPGAPKAGQKQQSVEEETDATPDPPSITITPPQNWEKVVDLVTDFRKTHTAPVDTVGCACLAEPELQIRDPKAHRFQTLVSLMLSSQTKDPITAAAMVNIQQHFRSNIAQLETSSTVSEPPPYFCAQSLLGLPDSTLNGLISKVGFHNRKTQYLKQAAKMCLEQHDGDVPASLPFLLSLPGVGPKMAHLFLQSAYGISEGIGVDTHVHRITNRFGWVRTESLPAGSPRKGARPPFGTGPEGTRKELESWLPRQHWASINPLLVGFGQVHCLPVKPLCSDCPVNDAGFCPTGRKIRKKGGTKMVSERTDLDFSSAPENLE
ncbi:DNA glycosylase [Gonapodya prolifera JEL478]|uniref:Endonuclease III homolog n=1 Tax=Gonapodya prolifera (strain JEL478) TaxID=1344416 RepID=A0A139AUE3_GONPJ|nr:DNA glycosylase [Gonapodya prolifera JEL478]|eukprot:KXS20352.1 DNA glycosylase [Gonapodya prolifera JEL478]